MGYPEKKKVLITGAKGFIGQYVRKALPEDCEILTVDGNLFETDMKGYMEEQRPDYLIHLAWVTGAGYSDSPDNLYMVAKSIEMYDAFYQNGGKRAVFVGTEQEYARDEKALTEESTLQPISLYAQCKCSLGEMLLNASKQYNRGFVWARLFFIYGCGEKPGRLMPSIIKAMLKAETVTCSCEQYVRDYIHVEDVAEGILTCLFCDYTGAVNICGGTRTSIGDIGRILQKISGAKGKVEYRSHEECRQPMTICGSNELLRSLGWSPRYTMETGLLEEYSQYQKVYENEHRFLDE